ncbi:MAG: ubiquinone/menaquinone biosynthesis methyltransferase [bacterium]|nr:ubiquinone/menaquinone biosynthesis methyltransferase [bacterium]
MADRSAEGTEADRLSRETGARRKAGVGAMFDRIAARYDLLNHLLSGGTDLLWRRHAVRALEVKAGGLYLDLAAGTGDYAFTILARQPDCRVLALDLAPRMLERMGEKARRRGLTERVCLLRGDGERLPLADASLDGLAIGYGIRNFPDKRQALLECGRVLKAGGRLAILELAGIPHPLLRRLFGLYFRLLLPVIGRLVSGDAMAYSYLPASVEQFPPREQFLAWMREAGLADAHCRELSLGVSTLFIGTRLTGPTTLVEGNIAAPDETTARQKF